MRITCAIGVAMCWVSAAAGGTDEPLFPSLGLYTEDRVDTIRVVDLDGDGTPELVCKEGDFRIATFRLVGGRYERLSTVISANEITSFIVADMDNDGNLDLVYSTATGPRVTFLWNNGNGDFTSGVEQIFGASNDTRSVAAADLNGNGLLDLVCSVSNTDKMHFIRNNAGRSFSSLGSSSAGAAPGAAVTGAFRGPGTADFAIVARDDDAVEYHRVSTSIFGAFSSTRTAFPIGAAPDSLYVADIDGDGFDDLLVPGMNQSVVHVFMGTSDGLVPAAPIPTSLVPTSVSVSDLNSDGHPEIVAVDRDTRTFAVFDGGPGGFEPERIVEIAPSVDALAFGDLDGDGRADLVFGTELDFVAGMPGDGVGGFVVRESIGLKPEISNLYFVFELIDLNGDGLLDLLVLDFDLNRLSVSLASEPGVFGSWVHYTTSSGPFTMLVADLTMNGHPDVVVSHFNNDVVHLYEGMGGGTLNPLPRTFTLGGFGYQIAARDMNGSGSLDLLNLSLMQNRMNISFNDGAGNFGPLQVSVPLGAPGQEEPLEMAIHDFDQDGDLDVAVISQFGTTLRIIRNEGQDGFALRNALPLPGLPDSMVVIDFDLDGDADIVVLIGGIPNQPGFRGLQVISQRDDAPGFFEQSTQIQLPPKGLYRGLVLAEIDGDGIEDLVIGCLRTASFLLLRGTMPGFDLPTPYFAGRVLSELRVVDLDADGDLDLVMFEPSTIGVLRNSRLSPVQPCPADTNGDGVLSPADFSAWIAAFNASAPECDQNADGLCTPADFSAWIANYNAGC